jgi:hypothetical protein
VEASFKSPMWENHQYGSVRAFIKIKLPKGNYNYEFYSTKAADNALKQIKDKKYAHELHSKGIKNIIAFGIACKEKKVFVKMDSGEKFERLA